MKRILSLLLVSVLLVGALCSCGGSAETLTGYFTKGDVGYFLTENGAVKVTADGAKVATLTVDGDSYTVDGDSFTAAELTAANFTAPQAAEEYFVIESGKLTGLTDLGKSCTVLFVPKGVTSIAAGAFKGSSVKCLVLGSYTGSLNLDNGCLEGLESLYVDGNVSPDKLTCGKDMLKNAETVSIAVGTSAYDTFKNHYNWGVFADNIAKY